MISPYFSQSFLFVCSPEIMESYTTMANLDTACHVSPSSVSGSRYESSPEKKCNKRPRENSMTQLSLEEAWTSLAKQLELFREEARRSQLLKSRLELSEGQSSLDEFSSQQDTAKDPNVMEDTQNALSSCADSKGEETVVSCQQHVKDQDTTRESETSEESEVTVGDKTFVEENCQQESVMPEKVEDRQPEQLCEASTLQDEELLQRGDRICNSLVDSRSSVNVPHVKYMDVCEEKGGKRIKLRSCRKSVRFKKGSVGEKYGTKDGHPERCSQRQLYSSMPSGPNFSRPLFTKKDIKEVEHLLGESNMFSIIRLRRRVGLEPKRLPDLTYVTWTKPSSLS